MKKKHAVFRKLLPMLSLASFYQYFAYKPTGGPSSSCRMIILHNNSHGGIIRVCMRIFTTALRNETIRQILNENTSPYFHSVSLVIRPFILMKITHFSELSISRFSTYIRKAHSAVTVIVQDDHLTAGAWAACDKPSVILSLQLGQELLFFSQIPYASGHSSQFSLCVSVLGIYIF